MTVKVDRRCDACGHRDGAHPYGEWDRDGRLACTVKGCECKCYRFNYIAALERRVLELESRETS